MILGSGEGGRLRPGNITGASDSYGVVSGKTAFGRIKQKAAYFEVDRAARTLFKRHRHTAQQNGGAVAGAPVP